MKRILLALPFVAIGVAATAQTPTAMSTDTVIAARQAGYELLQAQAQALKVAVDQGLDPKPFADPVKAMANWGHTIPVLFPDGTQTGHNTKALPAVWSDRAGFTKAASDFTTAAEKLQADATAGNKDAFKADYQAMGATCGACHRTYRARS